MMNLDELLDEALIEGALASGATPKRLAAQFPEQAHRVMGLAAIMGGEISNWDRTWTEEEEAQLDAELGVYSIAEIARRHGRSQAAIKIRWTRLGLTAPSKRQMTGQEVATALGMDIHSIMKLLRRGLLPGERVTEKIWGIKRQKLLQWVINPFNWMCFKLERVQDSQIKRLVCRQQQRWSDEWWITGQVAEYHGVTCGAVNKKIRQGELPAKRWGNWWVLRSDAVKCHFVIGTGSAGYDWSEEGDVFMVLATAVGMPHPWIAERRGEYSQRVDARVKYLLRDGRSLRRLLAEHGVNVVVGNGRLWADWRDYEQRFPGLARAVGRFLRRERLSVQDRVCIRGVMHSWMDWYVNQGWFPATDQMKSTAARLKYGNTAGLDVLWADYATLKGWGIDPFGRCK